MTVTKKTVGTAADYADLELWETGQAKNCVTADVIERAALKDEEHAANFALTHSSWVTDITRYIWISADDGAEHDGTAGSGARVTGSTSDHIISISKSGVHVKFSSFELTPAVTTADQAAFFNGIVVSALVFDRMLIHGFTAGSGRGLWFNDVDMANVVVVNSLFYDISHRSIGTTGPTRDHVMRVYNCTSDTTSMAFEIDDFTSGSRDYDIRNNLIKGSPALFNSRSDDAGWNASCNKNITNGRFAASQGLPGDFIDSATFQAGTGGSGTRVMVANLTGGSEDYTILEDSDNAALHYGDNLSAVSLPMDTSLGFDIIGTVRSTFSPWDAGAFNLTFRGTSKTISASRRRMMTMQTPAVGPIDIIEVTGLPADFPHNFLSVQFYDASGDQIVPTAGTILLEIETVSGSPNFELMVDGVVDATNPATLTWAANTHSLRATPTGLEDGGVNSWRIVATFNRT